MANKINFITGETYTLAELFSGERQIIIPDLQRDYCWGSPSNEKASGVRGELVSDFIDNLFTQYQLKDKAKLNLGLIYGYEVPADHIQLCDGQQRLTTLFLLLGMVNKYTGKFRQYLISDYEYKHDDKEPYLKYAIRESSLYFLSDLVCQFFISNSSKVERIKTADWYFADYNLDPSIQSMVDALDIIEKKLDGKSTEWLTDFGDWLVNKLTFLYFDMETRKNGEETFVIINTTGEPLSATQNLKPLVLKADINKGIDDADKKWEEMETWFWKKRKVDNGNDTAEAGFAEFLRWITIIHADKEQVANFVQGTGKIQFPYKTVSIDDIVRYHEAVKWIYSRFNSDIDESYFSPKINENVGDLHAISQINAFVLLPVIKFCYKYLERLRDDAVTQRNARRIYEFFKNLSRINNVSSTARTLVYDSLQIIDRLDSSGDIISLLNGNNSDISKQLLSEEEIHKLEILRDSANREEVEELFWRMQELSIWTGEIWPAIKWAEIDNHFSYQLFRDYVAIIEKIFNGKPKHEPLIRLMRRCLIACIKDYKPLERNSYHTFGWNESDWWNLLDSDTDGIREFLNYIVKHRTDTDYSDIELIMGRYIRENLDYSKNFAEFAMDDYLLSFCSNYCCDVKFNADDWHICTNGSDSRHSAFLSRRNIYILREFSGTSNNYCSATQHLLPESNWGVWYYAYWVTFSCIVFENKGLKLKIDARWDAENTSLVLELKPTTDDGVNYERIVGLLPEFVPEEEEFKAIFIKKMEHFDVVQIKIVIEEFMHKIDELASAQ